MSLTKARWTSKRLRYLTQRGLSEERRRLLEESPQVTFLPMEAIGEHGELDLSSVRKREDVQTGYTQFFDGDVVVAKITPCFENGKGALISGTLSGVGFGTTELHVLTPTSEIDGRYLYYVTASAQFRRLGEAHMIGAAGQKRVPEEFVSDYCSVVPSLAQQRSIVAYLDRETARVDELLTAKKRVLGLLAEMRRALIGHAVTRGLDPGASLRDSGIPWLMQVPAQWEVKRGKWLFKERDERSTTGEEVLLSLRMERGLVPHNEVSDKPTRSEELIGYKKVARGEIVVNRMRAASGLIAVSPQEGLVSPDYAVFKCAPRVDQDYFTYLFKTELLQSVFRSESTGLGTGSSGFLRLYSESFLSLWFPYPSYEDQQAIVANIAYETRKLDSLREATEHTLLLLEERRASLITAAVTGQISVE